MSGPLTARGLKAIRYGANTATIRVDRPPLKPGERCTRPWATSKANVRYIAVAGDLSLTFGADLRAIPSETPHFVRKPVKSGDPVTVQGTSRFVNLGPSSAFRGTVNVNVTGDGQSVLVSTATHADGPLECTLQGGSMNCTFDELKPGQKTAVHIYAGTQVNTAYFRNGHGKMTIQWSISAPGRDPGSNNLTQVVVELCTADATDPACA